MIKTPAHALLIVALAAVTTACSSTITTVEQPASLQEFDATVDIDRLWSTSVAGEDETGLLLGLAPASDGRVVYIAGRDGRVEALDLVSGRRAWSTEVPRLSIGSTESLGLWNRVMTNATAERYERLAAGPTVGGGLVVVGSSDGEVAALDAADGHLLWNVLLGGEVNTTPTTDGKLVVVRLANGQMIGLDAQDGKQLWFAEQPVPSLTLRGSGRPLLDGNRVIAGFDNGKVAAYEPVHGQPLWEAPLALATGRSEIERLVDADGAMRMSDGELFAAAYHGRAASIDPETGNILWQRDLSSAVGLSADATAVYVTDADSQVWALDRVNGGPLWTQADLRARMLTAPAVVGDAVVVGDLDGYLHLLDRTSGRVIGREHVGGGAIVAQPLTIDDVVVVQTADGGVAAYRIVPHPAKGG